MRKRFSTRSPQLAARFDPAAVTGAAPGSAGVFALAAIPARWVLERSAWKEAAAHRAQGERVPIYRCDVVFRPRPRRIAHARPRARASLDRLARIDRAATERLRGEVLDGAGRDSASGGAGMARSRRAPERRRAGAHARGCDARGCDREERRHPRPARAGARAARRHAHGPRSPATRRAPSIAPRCGRSRIADTRCCESGRTRSWTSCSARSGTLSCSCVVRSIL